MTEHRPARQLHALLVDDDPSTSGVYAQRLESEGYQVTSSADPTTALGLARRSAVDMIFIHLGHGGSGSMEFIQALRSHDETRIVPIALLSNYYDRALEGLGFTAVRDGR
jgi:DNA-binding response OmpR family regulator